MKTVLTPNENVQNEDLELDFAIALSLSEGHGNNPKNEKKEEKQEENDEELDFALALSLSGGKEEISKKGKQEEDNDAKFALLLQAEELQNQFQSPLLTQFETSKKQEPVLIKDFEKYFDAIAALKPVLEHPAVKGETSSDGELTNAHKYTSTEIRTQLPFLIKMDNSFKMSDASLTADEVEKEVLVFVSDIPLNMSPPDVGNIKKTFAVIPKDSPVESSETNANIPQLLSSTWSLAKLIDNKLGNQNACGEIAQTLHLNIADGGSCMAGLVARLYSPYAKMIDWVLKERVNFNRITSNKNGW